jgi:hypothetical protein
MRSDMWELLILTALVFAGVAVVEMLIRGAIDHRASTRALREIRHHWKIKERRH